MSSKITVRTVARESGISIATVSRVINNDSRVHPDTRKRVIEAARHLGYIPIPGNGRVIVGLILSHNCNLYGYQGAILQAVRHKLSDAGWRTELISESDIDLLHSRSIAGAISIAVATSSNLIQRWAELKTIPLVSLNFTGDHSNNIYSVTSDGIGAMEQSMNYLRQRGHRKICLISNSSRLQEERFCARRLEGFLQYWQHLGEPHPENFCIFDWYSHIPDFHELRKAGFTAIQAVGEEAGLQLSRQMLIQNIRVPEDLSIISMEYPGISQYLPTPHTTISQSFDELAFQSVKLLERLIQRDPHVTDCLVPYQLIERESVRTIED